MVMLQESDIQTKEVLSWQGLHLFHFAGSTCSQKTRIFLRLKGIDWTSRHVNLIKKEQLQPFYMGINPRGLVPTLVHDGQVIIESNDILEYLEAQFPQPALIPTEQSNQVSALLQAEDNLHLDIRALTMRFVFPQFLAKRPEKDIAVYETSGSGTVSGEVDADRAREVKFYRDMNAHGGITDAQALQAYERFKAVLDQYDLDLAQHDYLLGTELSVVDIAWYIYARRLLDAGYPMAELHPNVSAWFDRLHANPEFREEVPAGGLPALITSGLHLMQKISRSRLSDIVRRDVP